MCSFYCHENNGEKKGPFILSVRVRVTFGTMLNVNGGNNGHGLKNVTCEQTFMGKKAGKLKLFCFISTEAVSSIDY